MAKTELRKLVALTLIPHFGGVTFRRCLETYGSAEAIFSGKKLRPLEGAPRVNAALREKNTLLKRADEEIKLAKKHDCGIVSYFDDGYPAELREIYDPPVVLYVQGKLPAASKPRIAVVGSRDASLYGLRMARSMSRDLSAAGVSVVSGLARGIDTAAHEGALLGGTETIAVLGGGILHLYPEENKKVAKKIAEKGAVISEYPLGMHPQPQYFPHRNRIISGLSRAVVVVEAREKSGALITADAALEQGRDVFAVPGNADSAKSGGTNRLLKQGARLATSADDILEELNLERTALAAPALSEEENSFLSLWSDGEAHPLDEAIAERNFPARRAASLATLLTLKGALKELPGKYFTRNTNP